MPVTAVEAEQKRAADKQTSVNVATKLQTLDYYHSLASSGHPRRQVLTQQKYAKYVASTGQLSRWQKAREKYRWDLLPPKTAHLLKEACQIAHTARMLCVCVTHYT